MRSDLRCLPEKGDIEFFATARLGALLGGHCIADTHMDDNERNSVVPSFGIYLLSAEPMSNEGMKQKGSHNGIKFTESPVSAGRPYDSSIFVMELLRPGF